MSEKALQITKERREVKGKGERERYTQLNAELQRVARRDKAFLNERCKEIGENNRMGKTRDLLKKIGDIKGTFQATVRTRHGTTDWSQIGKGVHQVCILSSCLFNLYAEYIM